MTNPTNPAAEEATVNFIPEIHFFRSDSSGDYISKWIGGMTWEMAEATVEHYRSIGTVCVAVKRYF